MAHHKDEDRFIDIKLLFKPKKTNRVQVTLQVEDGASKKYVLEDVEVIGDRDPALFEGKRSQLIIISGRVPVDEDII